MLIGCFVCPLLCVRSVSLVVTCAHLLIGLSSRPTHCTHQHERRAFRATARATCMHCRWAARGRGAGDARGKQWGTPHARCSPAEAFMLHDGGGGGGVGSCLFGHARCMQYINRISAREHEPNVLWLLRMVRRHPRLPAVAAINLGQSACAASRTRRGSHCRPRHGCSIRSTSRPNTQTRPRRCAFVRAERAVLCRQLRPASNAARVVARASVFDRQTADRCRARRTHERATTHNLIRELRV